MDSKEKRRKKERAAKQRSALENRVRSYWKKYRSNGSQGSLSETRQHVAKKFGISIGELNTIVRDTEQRVAAAERKNEEYIRKQAEQQSRLAHLEKMRVTHHRFDGDFRCLECGLPEHLLVHEARQIRIV